MIKLVRVDHRLLHGQVIFSWTKQVGTNLIIVADDMILSILVDTFSSRILNPMLLPSGKRNIVVF